MRINSIGYMPYNNICNRTVNNTPSFGEVKCVPDDELLLSYDDWRANPKALLKVVKSQKDNEKASKIFDVLLYLRGEELRRKKTEQEKEKIITKIQNIYHETSSLLDGLSSDWNEYLLANANDKVSALEMKLSQYSKTKPYDGSRFRTYGEAAKLLSKMPSFDPNYEAWECYLVDDSLSYDDDELALVLMRHKKYNSLNSYISDENRIKFNNFLVKTQHIFF